MRSGLRRTLHACSALVVVPALWIEWDAVRRLLLILAAGAAGLELLRLASPGAGALFARWIPVWRPHEARRPSGAGWLAVAFAIAARAPMPAALGGVFAAAWADPAASVVGGRFGGGAAKSVAGSLAALAVTTGGVIAVGFPLPVAVVAGLMGAACERWLIVPDDNLWLAPGVTLVLVAFA